MTLVYAKFANPDEAYAAAIGERLLEGYRLYEGAVSQRGPLMYYAFAGLADLFGWDNVLAIRVFALAFAFAHVAVVYLAGYVLISGRGALISAAIVSYALAFGLIPNEGLVLHGEALIMPFLLVAVIVGGLAMMQPSASWTRRRLLVMSGLLFGTTIGVKQTVFAQSLPLGAWLIAEAWALRAKWRDALTEILLLLLAVLCVPAALLIHAWKQGTLRQLAYYCYTYNIQVHRLGGRWSLPVDVLQRYPCFLLGTGAVVALTAARWSARASLAIRSRRLRALAVGFGKHDYIAMEFVFAFATAAVLPQFFEHYYLVPIPFLALALASVPPLAARLPRLEPYVRWSILGAAAVFVVGAVQTPWVREKPDGRVAHGPNVEQVGLYIAQHTAAEDRVFVWGFSPWLYEYSHRRPATRFVFTTYPIGFVPWFREALDIEPSRAVPGAMEELLDDLRRERPTYVVDAGSVAIARPMRAYTGPAALLRERYCFDVRIGSFDLYRIAPKEGTCDTPLFPRPADPVDHFDKPLSVEMPRVIDFDASYPLPTRMVGPPVRFSAEGGHFAVSQPL
jgi:4-amino-4-deoxy-L-arabinose transferase-like glycosyltransferase